MSIAMDHGSVPYCCMHVFFRFWNLAFILSKGTMEKGPDLFRVLSLALGSMAGNLITIFDIFLLQLYLNVFICVIISEFVPTITNQSEIIPNPLQL